MRDETRHLNTVDFHHVDPKHYAIHERLERWSIWVMPRRPSWIAPMFKLARSNARQWHVPEIRPQVDGIEAQATEKAVCALPDAHRQAVRWAYCIRNSPAAACSAFGVSRFGLMLLIRDGRTMLINRGL